MQIYIKIIKESCVYLVSAKLIIAKIIAKIKGTIGIAINFFTLLLTMRSVIDNIYEQSAMDP